MNVSAQVKYLDYSVRALNSKNRRRPHDDILARRKADPRPDDEPRDGAEPALAQPILEDDDESLGYSRQLAQRTLAVRRDVVADTVRPMASPNSGLLTLIAAGDGRTRGAEPALAQVSAKPRDAFYDLLDQVIAQA
jgi:hypothetical protein